MWETFIGIHWELGGTSLVAQMVKCLPAMQETWVQSLGQEDPLEKEMATYSSTLAWKIAWMEEPGRLQSMGSQRVGHDWATSLTHWELQLSLWGRIINPSCIKFPLYFKNSNSVTTTKKKNRKYALTWLNLFGNDNVIGDINDTYKIMLNTKE